MSKEELKKERSQCRNLIAEAGLYSSVLDQILGRGKMKERGPNEHNTKNCWAWIESLMLASQVLKETP
jgi:hypothetical protein